MKAVQEITAALGSPTRRSFISALFLFPFWVSHGAGQIAAPADAPVRPPSWAQPIVLEGAPNLHLVDENFYRSAPTSRILSGEATRRHSPASISASVPCHNLSPRSARIPPPRKSRGRSIQMGHVWTAPAVQEESDVSAKRSGAAMYTAYFRLEDCLCRDAAAVAAGPDVIR
jgi:hypothetical protein